MSGISASGLKTQIRSYTETDSNVLSDSVLENIILNAQYRIMRDVPIDADRKQQLGNFVAGQESINAPAGCLFVRGIQVYDTAGSEITGANRWLEKKDLTYLQEYQDVTGTSAAQGQPKYYAMFGGATGNTDTTSGRIFVAPTPNTTYRFRIHFNKMVGLLEGDNTNYISLNFPNGLLYCCLSETYGFLKGPIDMLTLYENKYKEEVQKFANEQVGRRRRDDYTDGTVRIPVTSANPQEIIMAITSAICSSFKQELLQGKHSFESSGGHTFKIALFTSSASLGASTTDYSTSNEISNTSGSAYSAGGATLTNSGVSLSSTTAFTDFSDVTYSSASFTANGALIYNTTTDGGSGTTDAVCVIAFGGDKTASNGTFKIEFPTADSSSAIIRLAQEVDNVDDFRMGQVYLGPSLLEC